MPAPERRPRPVPPALFSREPVPGYLLLYNIKALLNDFPAVTFTEGLPDAVLAGRHPRGLHVCLPPANWQAALTDPSSGQYGRLMFQAIKSPKITDANPAGAGAKRAGQ